MFLTQQKDQDNWSERRLLNAQKMRGHDKIWHREDEAFEIKKNALVEYFLIIRTMRG